MKKFLILTVLLVAFALPVSAEQPAAEQYRQMFASGNFYVEYEVADKSGNWVSPDESVSSPIRYSGIDLYGFNRSSSSLIKYSGMVRDKKKHRHEIRAGLNGQRIAKSGVRSKYPNALYQDGKYYKFTLVIKTSSGGINSVLAGGIPSSKLLRNAMVLEEDKIYSPTLDPDEGWQRIRADLTLPEAFCVLFPNDPMSGDAQISPKPIFNGSSKREIDGKEYDCDQYINDIKSLAGSVIALEAYNVLYDTGKLSRIQKYLCRDGKELLVSDLIIKAISSEVPDEAFAIRKKFKLYAARNGDMNDLIDKPEQIGAIGGSSK